MLEQFTEYLKVLLLNFGSWAVFFTMTVESMGAPLPSEVIMPLAGFLVFQGEMEMWEAVSAGTLGCAAGSYFAYLVGRKWGDKAIEHVGRFLLVSPRSLERAKKWFARYGQSIVFWARLLPVLRGVVSYPAGSARLRIWRFLLFSTIGSLLWCWLFAWLGFLLGENWEKIYAAMHGPILYIVIAALVLLLTVAIIFFLRRRKASL